MLYSLAGLLETNSGEIYINDKKIDQSRIYKDFKVGIVPQQTYIMPGSIFENVTLRDNETDLNEDKATEAIRTSGLSTFLSEFQKGVKQELAENSKSISGGQAQRFSIARLIYKNSDILLLDEFTSALDKDTKKDLIQEIKKISRDKIILISSHTEDVLDICDEIIDMDKC